MGNSPLKNARKKASDLFSSSSSRGSESDLLAPFYEPPEDCKWDPKSVRKLVLTGQIAPIVEGGEQKVPMRWVLTNQPLLPRILSNQPTNQPTNQQPFS